MVYVIMSSKSKINNLTHWALVKNRKICFSNFEVFMLRNDIVN